MHAFIAIESWRTANRMILISFAASQKLGRKGKEVSVWGVTLNVPYI